MIPGSSFTLVEGFVVKQSFTFRLQDIVYIVTLTVLCEEDKKHGLTCNKLRGYGENKGSKFI